MGFLSESESCRFSAMRFPKRREEWLLGRWAAKSLVHGFPAYRSYPLDEIEIKNTADGMPYIHPIGGEVAPECVSISHSGPFALCALSPDSTFPIGVDLERIEPRSGTFLEDYFTQAELDLVFCSLDANRTMLVNLIWSTKEAMLKALGTGLRRDTRSVEVYQMDGLLSEDGKWHRLLVREPEYPHRNWAAWGRQRGDFIITLAGFPTMKTDIPFLELVEK